MLYLLAKYLLAHGYYFPGIRLFTFITFRAALAVIIALTITIRYGGHIINWIKNRQMIEKERVLGLPGEETKKKTPTMGGLMIITAILIPTLLLGDLTNVYILLMILSTVWMGIIGFVDDYLKLTRGKEGLAGKYKVIGQVGLGLIVGCVMYWSDNVVVRVDNKTQAEHNYEVIKQERVEYPVNSGKIVTMNYVKTTSTNLPFMKNHEFDYAILLRPFFGDDARSWAWLIFIPIVIFIVTAVSNAANLTDGIDGLAAGTSGIVGATLAILAYVSGNSLFSQYLGIHYIPYSGELVIFTTAFLGACVGFLWYNAYPAQVFMGDTGSLTLGGIIAALAIVLRKELLIPILCGIFLAENLSVVLQVMVFKYRKKRFGLEYAQANRLLRMSPLHHHFQKGGMHESKIVIRFWIVSIILAIVTIITLKIR